MVEKMKARMHARRWEKREDGLALLDVLIGMAIFALIAVIAVSAISQYRAKANVTAVVSDAKRLGLQLTLWEKDKSSSLPWPAPTQAESQAYAEDFFARHPYPATEEGDEWQQWADAYMAAFGSLSGRLRPAFDRAGIDATLSPGNDIGLYGNIGVSIVPGDYVMVLCIKHKDGAWALWAETPVDSAFARIGNINGLVGYGPTGENATC